MMYERQRKYVGPGGALALCGGNFTFFHFQILQGPTVESLCWDFSQKVYLEDMYVLCRTYRRRIWGDSYVEKEKEVVYDPL